MDTSTSSAEEAQLPPADSGFDSLTADLLLWIISKANLTVQELCRDACVCRRMRKACYAPSLWRSLTVHGNGGGNVYGAGLEAIANRCKGLEDLVLEDVVIKERPNPWVHFGFEQLLQRCGGALRRLRLRFVCDLFFTDLLVTKVGGHCPGLVDFELSARNYYATDAVLTAFVRQCPHMEHFRCFVHAPSPVHSLGDTALWNLAKKWRALRTLEINGHHVSENGLFALEECEHLEFLSLHGYKRGVFDRARATEDGKEVLFPRLAAICFAYMLPTSAELKRLIRMCPELSRVELRPEDGDEKGKQHARALADVAAAESGARIDVAVRPLTEGGKLVPGGAHGTWTPPGWASPHGRKAQP